MKSLIRNLNPFSNEKVDNKILYIIKILLSAFLVYFVSLIIGEVFIIGGSSLFGYNATDKQLPTDIMLLCSFYGYLFTILLFILFCKKINKIKLKKIGIDKNLMTFLRGIFLGVISLIFIIMLLIIFGAIKFNGINHNINCLFFILYLFGFLIQSTMEELICRGYILHRLKERIPIVFVILISILFFSIGHFSKLFDEGIIIGIIGILNLFLIGSIWAITTLKDKNIYSAIGFHFIWNFALFNIIGLNLSGIESANSIFKFTVVDPFLTGSSYGIESSIITTIILLIIITTIILSIIKNKTAKSIK